MCCLACGMRAAVVATERGRREKPEGEQPAARHATSGVFRSSRRCGCGALRLAPVAQLHPLQVDLPAVRTLPALMAELLATVRHRSGGHKREGLSYLSKWRRRQAASAMGNAISTAPALVRLGQASPPRAGKALEMHRQANELRHRVESTSRGFFLMNFHKRKMYRFMWLLRDLLLKVFYQVEVE